MLLAEMIMLDNFTTLFTVFLTYIFFAHGFKTRRINYKKLGIGVAFQSTTDV